MKKTLSKKTTHNLFYKLILNVLNMMVPTSTMKQVKSKLIKHGKSIKYKVKSKEIRNTRTNLFYMEDSEAGCYWYDYVTWKELPMVHNENFTYINQVILYNRVKL